ncbi:MAG TPA: hypothetical protein VFB44_12975 [Thermoleophilaceae bacterium]|nr:hypothetical protein [Thermoleophilaceae bacterium]
MTATGTDTTLEQALFGRLVDHAALFPPASMSIPDAAAEDRQARESPQAWMLARFVCPASKLADLRAEMPWEGAPGLSVVLDGAGAAPADGWADALAGDVELVARAAAEGAPVESVELRLPGSRPEPAVLVRARAALEALAVESFFELAPDERWHDALPADIGAVAALGGRVKLRCGGASAEAFPPVELVALVIASCHGAGVPFKATAGLHHPIRHVDEASGFPMHGFLNLLAASTLAHAQGARPGELERVLAEEDEAAFRVAEGTLEVAGRRASAAEIAATRRSLFTSYGSCSWREPVEDLQALGMLA